MAGNIKHDPVAAARDSDAMALRSKAAQGAMDYLTQQLQASDLIGIGTGNTVEVFIRLLAASSVNFTCCIASSQRSSQALAQAGINQQPLGQCNAVDFYIDGIDEGMKNGITVKGGGGALAREKILAGMAKTFITIADHGRLVQQLGRFPLPVEILPVAQCSVGRTLELMGGRVQLRENFITDNGNIILDVAGLAMHDPVALEMRLNNIPGIVENGIFSQRKADVMLFSHNGGVERIMITR